MKSDLLDVCIGRDHMLHPQELPMFFVFWGPIWIFGRMETVNGVILRI